WGRLARLTHPTPAASDGFGISVAVSGNTAVVGANYDDTGAQDAGSAYVFNATSGALIATINNPTPATGDQFGSVAISGNLVVVGDKGGSAHVFNAITGALIATLTNPTPAQNDLFGYSVAVSGNTLVVGAYGDDTQNTDQGAAYVYSIAAPRVQSVQVNDGSAQRSQVKGLTVTFDAQVSFAGTVGQAFTL